MARPNLNHLVTLDALLSTGSVAAAARRLGLSPSAMSRALAGLRATTGDPLLVRAGRGLVLTPRARELREQVGRLVREGEAILRAAEALDLARLERTFALRSSEGFAETFGAALIARLHAEAPGVRLRLVQKLDKDGGLLRDATIDLETGVVDQETAPELRAQALFRDRFVGVVRQGHPLAAGEVTAERYASAAGHVVVSPRGRERNAIDDALAELGRERRIAVLVGGFATALALARASDLVATVPERHTAALRDGMHTFPLPVASAEITVSLLWHPRMDADPAHRWLRDHVREVCAAATATSLTPVAAAELETRTG